MRVEPMIATLADARRLEELSLNASGASQSFIYDGWLLGCRPGPSKRSRCVNPLYPSTLPLPEKVRHCAAFYRNAGLPMLFRVLPFCEPPELDDFLDREGCVAFDRTLVQRVGLIAHPIPAASEVPVEIVSVPEWVAATASLFAVEPEALPRALDRARSHPFPHAGALLRRDGRVVACGLLKLERDSAGLFAMNTEPEFRRQGLGRAIVVALLAEAQRRGAREAYLQVTASNVAALALYGRFGFATAYHYWYRAAPGAPR